MLSNTAAESDEEEGQQRHLCVTPLKQSRDYDCGLACVSMLIASVCEALGRDSSVWTPEVVYHYYDNMSGGNQSIWTIDLFALLHEVFQQLGVSVRLRFTTTMLGCNPEYATSAFYVMDYGIDGQRIDKLFISCVERGYDVQRKSYTSEQLLRFLSRPNTAMIVLIDSCHFLERHYAVVPAAPAVHPVVSAFLSCFGCPAAPPAPTDTHDFQGHYVVATGYNAATGHVCINNPSSLAPEEIPLDVFERARSAFGTDNDVIAIIV